MTFPIFGNTPFDLGNFTGEGMNLCFIICLICAFFLVWISFRSNKTAEEKESNRNLSQLFILLLFLFFFLGVVFGDWVIITALVALVLFPIPFFLYRITVAVKMARQ